MATPCPIDWSSQLPTELTLEIFECLDEQSLCRLASTCRNWQGLTAQPSLWYEICCRTQSQLDLDRSLHWKEKFRKRFWIRKRFLSRKSTRRYVIMILSSLACCSLALYAVQHLYVQHRHLTAYDTVQGRIDRIEIIQHESANEDAEQEFSYEFILHYSYRDPSGFEWHSWNLWPLPSANMEYATRTAAIDAAYEIGEVGNPVLVCVDWSERPPYSYLMRTAVFEPHFHLIVALIGLCIVALFDAMSYSVLHINPDTTDLKVFVPCVGRYLYPIIDNRLDSNSKLRRQQGILLAATSALFHIFGPTSVFYYVHYSADTSILWIFGFLAEPVALYAAYQGWHRLRYYGFQPLLFCDRRPYLLLGATNKLSVVFQTETNLMVNNATLITSLMRADQEIVMIPGEPNRTKIVYTLLHEQDVTCRHGIAQWMPSGQHFIDNVEIVIPNHLQESSPLDQVAYPRYFWKIIITVSCNGSVFSRQLIVLVKHAPATANLY